MYYFSKGFQLVGLLVIGAGFINKFPQLMDYKPVSYTHLRAHET